MKKRIYPILAFIPLLCFLLTSCSSVKSVTIASKQFAENILLSEMYAQLIENRTDIKVARNQNMGPTAVCFAAMENGEVDIYVEYTGTIYKEILKREDASSAVPGGLYHMIKQEMNDTKNVTLYGSIGLNNTYALAMRREKAEALDIESMSDLSGAAPKLVFSANDVYFTRVNDGYATMVEKYDMHFSSVVKMSSLLSYEAVSNDRVDVMVVYATDSLLPKYDMVILRDDKRMFPDYYAVPIVRNEVLERYPELDGVMDLLAESIDNERMQELNYLIDIENKQPEEVAKTFLTGLGLI